MERIIVKLILLILLGSLVTGCSYSQSALEYAKEGTQRVDAGYKAKAEMTKYLTDYLIVANKDCGVKVEIVDNKPVTTVKECVRAADVMASVDKVELVKPQHIADIAQGVGDFFTKATGLVVPFASIYYGYKNNTVNQNANVAINKSNNDAQTSMWSSYTGNYQNSVTNTTDTSLTNTQTTDKEITNEKVPTINIDINSTSIGL